MNSSYNYAIFSFAEKNKSAEIMCLGKIISFQSLNSIIN